MCSLAYAGHYGAAIAARTAAIVAIFLGMARPSLGISPAILRRACLPVFILRQVF
jgi:hypothetical protein